MEKKQRKKASQTDKRRRGNKAAEERRRSSSFLKSRVAQIAFYVSLAIVVMFYVHFQSPAVPDMDIFYHLGHAKVYLEEGPFYHQFPWATYSVIREYGADIWYGFHLLLVPPALIANPVLQVKAAGLLVLGVFLVLLYVVLRRHNFSFPFVWPLVLIFSSGPFVGRMSTSRPHILTLGLGTLLFSLSLIHI